jgi:hypothetical protein
VIEVKNNTKIKVPKKYEAFLDEIDLDGDGYWGYSKKGYQFEAMGGECHTAHEDTQKELLAVIRTLMPCNCKECTN